MEANYGYSDGSGDYFIVINTDDCDGCNRCVEVCPQSVLELLVDDYEETVAAVGEAFRKKLKESCAACKPVGKRVLPPCIESCAMNAISHSW